VLGRTGEYPDGKYCHDDQGELRMAIAADKKKGMVVFNFGRSVNWLVLPKKVALELARVIREKAESLP
jgi:hypothetical protein